MTADQINASIAVIKADVNKSELSPLGREALADLVGNVLLNIQSIADSLTTIAQHAQQSATIFPNEG